MKRPRIISEYIKINKYIHGPEKPQEHNHKYKENMSALKNNNEPLI